MVYYCCSKNIIIPTIIAITVPKKIPALYYNLNPYYDHYGPYTNPYYTGTTISIVPIITIIIIIILATVL